MGKISKSSESTSEFDDGTLNSELTFEFLSQPDPITLFSESNSELPIPGCAKTLVEQNKDNKMGNILLILNVNHLILNIRIYFKFFKRFCQMQKFMLLIFLIFLANFSSMLLISRIIKFYYLFHFLQLIHLC